nr:MAG TPA: hypothetical protein [Caudoviricetes sp.]
MRFCVFFEQHCPSAQKKPALWSMTAGIMNTQLVVSERVGIIFTE